MRDIAREISDADKRSDSPEFLDIQQAVGEDWWKARGIPDFPIHIDLYLCQSPRYALRDPDGVTLATAYTWEGVEYLLPQWEAATIYDTNESATFSWADQVWRDKGGDERTAPTTPELLNF